MRSLTLNEGRVAEASQVLLGDGHTNRSARPVTMQNRMLLIHLPCTFSSLEDSSHSAHTAYCMRWHVTMAIHDVW